MLAQCDTELYADAIEFCPLEQYENLMVCATYQLDEAAQQRLGRLYVFDTTYVLMRLASRSSSIL
jgi:hypothetical protein